MWFCGWYLAGAEQHSSKAYCLWKAASSHTWPRPVGLTGSGGWPQQQEQQQQRGARITRLLDVVDAWQNSMLTVSTTIGGNCCIQGRRHWELAGAGQWCWWWCNNSQLALCPPATVVVGTRTSNYLVTAALRCFALGGPHCAARRFHLHGCLLCYIALQAVSGTNASTSSSQQLAVRYQAATPPCWQRVVVKVVRACFEDNTFIVNSGCTY